MIAVVDETEFPGSGFDVPDVFPTGEIAPEGEVAADVGSHVVCTSQFAQSKLMVSFAPTAFPWKLPEESIVTPVKEIHPLRESHANPPKVPLSFVTPPFVGDRLIQPSFSLHTYPDSPELVTVTVLSVGLKFTHPPTLLQAYLYVELILLLEDAWANGTETKTERKNIPTSKGILFLCSACCGMGCC